MSENKNISDQVARLAIDIGGTFTDVVLESGGGLITTKVATTPSHPERGVVDGIKIVMARAGAEPSWVTSVIHGTTLATNALIERKGAVTALVTTMGFRDVLDIAYENRYDQYDVFLDKPQPLVPRYLRFPVSERVNVHGDVLVPLDRKQVQDVVAEFSRHGVTSVAVGFLHSYVNPKHEQAVRDMLSALAPDLAISLSSEVCPEVREFERLSTTTANAYIQPLMASYLTAMKHELAASGYRCPMYLMTSGGGMTTLETAVRFPIRLVESGPSGGAILASHAGARSREDQVLSFDMGGTTAKICLIDHYVPQKSRSFEVSRAARFLKGSGLPVRVPVIDMIEIGAGGGSVASVDSLGRLTVGPESAGSQPGPACYGRGGDRATVTDADVALGRIDPLTFADGQLRLDVNSARGAIERHVGLPLGLVEAQASTGISEIVDENMSNAARVHAVERGKDLTQRTLVAFGGSGPLHAARLAEKLGIPRVLVPENPGVGSAVGFLIAPIAYEVVRSRYTVLKALDVDAINTVFRQLRDEAHAVVRAGAPDADLVEMRNAYMRYVGQGHEIEVAVPSRDLDASDSRMLQAKYEESYQALYGRIMPETDIEVLLWSLAVSTTVEPPIIAPWPSQEYRPSPLRQGQVHDTSGARLITVPIYWRPDLKPGARAPGPAIVAEGQTTTVVSAAFDFRVDGARNLVLERR